MTDALLFETNQNRLYLHISIRSQIIYLIVHKKLLILKMMIMLCFVYFYNKNTLVCT